MDKEDGPISHLDFDAPEVELKAVLEPLEQSRMRIIGVFAAALAALDHEYGPVNQHSDNRSYAVRMRQLEERLEDKIAGFGLRRGDLVQANMPEALHISAFSTSLEPEAPIRAVFEELLVSLSDPNRTNLMQKTPMTLKMSIRDPAAVGHDGSLQTYGDVQNRSVTRHVDLHSGVASLHKVIFRDNPS